MAITAALVKELREKTGAGMMDCKKALTECDGDLDASVDWLRKKGIASAGKKAGRTASEGVVAVAENNGKGVIVELNIETDFAAKNESFQKAAKDIAQVALENSIKDIDTLKAATYPGKSHTVEDEVKELIGSIGENVELRRIDTVEGDNVASYIHNKIADGLGQVGVIVAYSTQGDAGKAGDFSRQVAMHVAAMKPEALNVEDLDESLVERERQVLTEQARASGKPDNVIEKMIEGRIRKFYAEVVLVEQAFVIDGKTPVKTALKEAENEIGGETSITGYARLTLGEGVEKEEEDFAAEVAKAAGA
jgi:elongation factor Ts